MDNCCKNSTEEKGMGMMYHRRGKWAFKLLAIMGVVYLAILARNAARQFDYIGRPTTQRDTIAIAADGKVTAVPDIAAITIGVQTENIKVAAAQTENTNKMNAIISKLKAMAISKDDIQTSSYNIYPQYDYTNNRQTLTGYQVTQSVEVKIRDLSKIGDVLTAAGDLGANQVSGVSFTIDDPDKLQQQARMKALAAAQMKAKALADAAGVRLGKVVGFSESVSGGSQPPIFFDKAMMASGTGGAAPTPSVQPGSQDIVVSVTVNYEIL